jgi:hypothetical protein
MQAHTALDHEEGCSRRLAMLVVSTQSCFVAGKLVTEVQYNSGKLRYSGVGVDFRRGTAKSLKSSCEAQLQKLERAYAGPALVT